MDQQKMIDIHGSDGDSNNSNNNKDEGYQWTNEKHSDFLRGMEAKFVRNMLKRGTCTYTNNHKSSRLDRFVPDISESTLDLNKSDRVSRTRNRQRERPNRPYRMSHDQVVPQVEMNKAGDKK